MWNERGEEAETVRNLFKGWRILVRILSYIDSALSYEFCGNKFSSSWADDS